MRTLLTICLLFTCFSIFAQSVVWNQLLISEARDGIWDIVSDDSDNTYVTGFFEGDVNLDGTILEHVDGQEFYLAKFDGSGNLIWAEAFVGSGFDRGDALTIDEEGNIILGGLFSGTMDVLGTEVTSEGSTDILVFSVDPDGDLNWVQTCGGDGSDICYGITAAEGKVYAVGHYSTTADFGPFSETSEGGSDAFVLCLEGSDGSVNWVKTFGSVNNDRLYAVSDAPDGDILTVGYFEETMELDGEIFTAQAGRDQILIRLNNNGDLDWGSVGMSPGIFATLQDVITDPDGNLYLSGSFGDSLQIAGQVLYGSSESIYNACVYSLDAQGNWRWGYSCNTPDDSYGSQFSIGEDILYQGFSITNGTFYDGSVITGLEMNAAGLARFTLDGEFKSVSFFDGPDNDYFGASALLQEDELVIGLGFEIAISLQDGVTLAGIGDQDVVIFRYEALPTSGTTEPTAPAFEDIARVQWDAGDQSLAVDVLVNDIDQICVYATDGRLLVQEKVSVGNNLVPLPAGINGMVVVRLSDGRVLYSKLIPVIR